MTKTKRLYTRRQKALRSLAWALGLLLICNFVFHIGLLFPAQAVRLGLQTSGVTERTEVVETFRVPEFNRRARFYLTAGENSVNLIGVRRTALGWVTAYVQTLDCSDDALFHMTQTVMRFDQHSYTAVYFGRVDDPKAALVQLADLDPAEGVYKGYSSSADVNVGRDGRRYFILEVHEPLRRPALELWYGEGDGLRVERYDAAEGGEWYRSSLDFYG